MVQYIKKTMGIMKRGIVMMDHHVQETNAIFWKNSATGFCYVLLKLARVSKLKVLTNLKIPLTFVKFIGSYDKKLMYPFY